MMYLPEWKTNMLPRGSVLRDITLNSYCCKFKGLRRKSDLRFHIKQPHDAVGIGEGGSSISREKKCVVLGTQGPILWRQLRPDEGPLLSLRGRLDQLLKPSGRFSS